MIAFPSMLLNPAREAGMKTPDDIPDDDLDLLDKDQYDHFYVYCAMQLGAPMPSSSSHWSNAKVIAAIPADKIRTMKPADIIKLGFETGYSQP